MDWILTQRVDKINGLKKCWLETVCGRNIWAQKSGIKRKVEENLKMTSKFVFIIKFYELVRRKIVGWTGLEGHLQEWGNEYITFLWKLLKKKLVEDLCTRDNDLKWALDKWDLEDVSDFGGSEKNCCLLLW